MTVLTKKWVENKIHVTYSWVIPSCKSVNDGNLIATFLVEWHYIILVSKIVAA